MEQELTFGQKAVGVNFNPSRFPEVDKVKQSVADAIDVLHDNHVKKEKPTWFENVFHTAGVNAGVAASSAIVKYLTWSE